MRGFLHSRSNNKREGGAILIMVLLIVALVSGLSIKFASQYQLGLARAESRWHGVQARSFLEGTEELAKLLFTTADIDPTIDYLGEPWSNEVPIDEEGVTGVAKLVDATSKLNLNDLSQGNPLDPNKSVGDPERYTEPQRRFIRLLQTFPDMQISQENAEYMLEAVIDWSDGDDAESGQGGAESNYYQGQPDPYMPANSMFETVHELRLVRGFVENPALVIRLMPFVTVLPTNSAGLNINTLEPITADGTAANNLLRSLNTTTDLAPLSDADAQQFIATRVEPGFASHADITDAWNRIFAGRPMDETGLKVLSNYFWLEASVQLVDQRRSIRSLLFADNERNLKVIQRDDVYELPNVVRPKEED